MRTVIKVEDNIKEILEFLEERGHIWASSDKPTIGMEWGSKYIIINDRILTHRMYGIEPHSISFKQFKENLNIMKTNRILPGYKLVLENGNVFVVKEYKGVKIAFPEGSSRSVTSLDELCDENLCPRNGISQIVAVHNSINIPIWKRVLTKSDIQAGFTMVNEDGVHYLVVECGDVLRIMSTKYSVVGARLDDIMNEDMSPFDSNYATIVEVKDKEGKVVYSKR